MLQEYTVDYIDQAEQTQILSRMEGTVTLIGPIDSKVYHL